MNKSLYTIYDKTAEECGPLFEAVNDGIALRQACNTLKNCPKSLIDEYSLVKVGELDTKTMQIFAIEPTEIDFSLALTRCREYDGMEVRINE